MDGAPTHPTRRYPVLVDLDGAHCLVVGGGPVAERRVSGLLDAGARVTVAAPHLTAGLQPRGEGGHLRILAEPFGPALLEPERGRTWRLVVAATADRSVNAEVVRLASGLGLWVNDASDPTGGPVAVPAGAPAGGAAVTCPPPPSPPRSSRPSTSWRRWPASWLRRWPGRLPSRVRSGSLPGRGHRTRRWRRPGHRVPIGGCCWIRECLWTSAKAVEP